VLLAYRSEDPSEASLTRSYEACRWELSCRHPLPYRHSFYSMYAHVLQGNHLHYMNCLSQYHRVQPPATPGNGAAEDGSMWFGAPCQPWAAKRHVWPGAYPTRCVGLRGRRVRALKQQRELGACSIELVSLSESLPITHSAYAEATPRGMGSKIGKDK
jgi:hypothetical protein